MNLIFSTLKYFVRFKESFLIYFKDGAMILQSSVPVLALYMYLLKI